MITDEQRKVRASGIFATDVARIMTGHGTEVALQKMGRLEREDISDEPQVMLGNLLEAPVIKAFSALTGLPCEPSPRTQMHPDIEWMGAHPDAIGCDRSGEGFTVECKAWSPEARSQFGNAGTDEVPDYVLWQAQAQLAVTGYARTYVPACFTTPENLVKFLTRGEVDIELFVVPRSEKLIAMAIAEAEKVWACVQEGRLPEPTKIGDAQLIYRQDNGSAIRATDEALNLYRQAVTHKRTLDAAKKNYEATKDLLQRYMGEAAELYDDHGELLLTWRKARDGKAFDEKAFSKAHPDLYAKFMKPITGSRRFLLKGAKD